MKYLALLLLLLCPAVFAQQKVNCSTGVACTTGGPSGTNTGDQAWLAFGKVNANFIQLYPNALLPGNQTPSLSAMQIDHLLESTPSGYLLQNEQSIWGSGQTYTFAGLSKEFTNTTVPGQGPTPLATLFAFANNNGATGDVVAVVGDAVARTASGTVFGANFIARNDTGIATPKLVGEEIDVEPAVATVPASTSAGLFLNIFNVAAADPTPAVQLGASGGGTWANGMLTSHITGAHFAVQSGDPTTAKAFINTANGTFSQTSIVFGTGAAQGIFFGTPTFGTSPLLYGDSSHNLVMNLGSAAWLWKNAAGTTVANVGSAGILTIPGIINNGTTFTLGTGTGACATSSTLTGGATAGSFLCTGTAGASTQVVNLPTATHGWACWANDDTSNVAWSAGSTATGTITLKGTIGTTSDKVVFGCIGF